jgi:3-hydroxyisobutyrate dehydrogenase-like beta-hydroxyacid dehydrogenase
MASPELGRVAFLGLGIMGWPMAANLSRSGAELRVWTHSAGKAERFAGEHRAEAASTPAEAANGAAVAITMLPDAPEVEATLLGAEGAAGALERGALCLDMSTIAPSAALALAERLELEGLAFLEAPVSGSKPKAEDGTLTVMAAGEQAAFERALPLLEVMGELIVRVGPRGHGALAKLLTNTMGAVHAAALGEALAAVRRADLDPDAFLKVAGASAGGSAVLALKGRPMLEGNFEPPLFKLDHMLKDVRHCLAEARALGLELRFGALAESLLARAAEDGRGDQDFAAVAAVAEASAGP